MLATDPWMARMLVADTFADRRVFLVGESAHVNPPWGGHGFNTSVGDAVNIAWKIAAVEQGWAAVGLLASYESERRGVVEQTVASAAANMRSLAGDLPADAAAIQRAKRRRVLQPRAGARLHLRRLARHPARRPGAAACGPSTLPAVGRARARGCRTRGCLTAGPCTTCSAAGSPSSARTAAGAGGVAASASAPATPASR